MGVKRSSKLKPYTWENLQIGEEFGPVEGSLSELKVKLHAFAVDDFGSWYFHGSPFGGKFSDPGRRDVHSRIGEAVDRTELRMADFATSGNDGV